MSLVMSTYTILLELSLITLFPLFLLFMLSLLRLIYKEWIQFLSEKHHYGRLYEYEFNVIRKVSVTV